MNKCRVTKKLSSYIDNQLSEKEKFRVETHIQDCKTCELELDRLKQISQKLKAWQPSGLDTDFDRAVRNKIVAWELERGQVKMNKKTLAILIPSSALAGILVIVFLGGLLQVSMKRAVRGGLGSSSDERMGEEQQKLFNEDYRETTFDCGAHVNDRVMTKGGAEKARQYQKTTTKVDPAYCKIMGAQKVWVGSHQQAAGMNYDFKHPTIYSGTVAKHLELAQLDDSSRRENSLENAKNGVSQQSHSQNLKLARDKNKEPTRAYNSDNGVLSWIPAETSFKNSLLAQGQVQGNSDGAVIVIQPVIPATGEGDKIIRSGTISLEVEDGRQTYNQALAICNELGGHMANSNFYKSQEGRESGTITMRIPKDKFTIALDRLSALGKINNINTNSEDVSQEYANLKSQLDAAMVVYNKMLEALQKRNVTIPDAVRLESELTPVLRRVEDLKNRIEYLNNAVSFTTISVDFQESEISLKALKESKRFIREGMLAAQIRGVKFLAAALPKLILIGVLSVIAIGVILALGQWIKQLLKRG
ncbi:MAG: DUF4349 domain-containing protein [Candidatus Omnitrophota bacterium]